MRLDLLPRIRNIGWSDRLGSGVRNLYKYTKFYSGQEPEFIKGDIFKTIVPLDEVYSSSVSDDKKRWKRIHNERNL